MVRYSDKAIDIIRNLRSECIYHEEDYAPLIDCAFRLAAYEDTRLTPEAVMWMKDAIDYAYGHLERFVELAKADKEGRVVVLPCKVGDILYRMFKERTKCSSYGEQFEEYSCSGCECECDSTIQLVIRPIQPNTLP